MSDLILYHGGRSEPTLNEVPADQIEERMKRAANLVKVPVSAADLSTVGRWGDGALTPLEGPMDSETFNRVLDEAAIEYNGKKYAWTIPLSLPTTEEIAKSLKPGQEVALVDDEQNIVATLELNDVFPWDKERYLKEVYLTDRVDHPGADMALVHDKDKTYLLGGKISVFPQKKNPDFGKYVLSPKETRALVAKRGWERVVAFQTRNPLHRAHEYALVYGLEKLLKEGLNAGACLNPLVGETKNDDVNAAIRMQTYESSSKIARSVKRLRRRTLEKARRRSPDRVILVGLDIKMFYGGPKER